MNRIEELRPRLENLRIEANNISTKKRIVQQEIRNLVGTLSYYLIRDPEYRHRKRIENFLREKEDELINIENRERRIKEYHAKKVQEYKDKREQN